jgi:hypothetical protein
MQQVTIKKTALLEKLKENRKEHKSDYTISLKGYKIEAKKKYEKALRKLEKKGKVTERFNLNCPQAYLAQYDTAIEMLEMSEETEFELTRSEFKQYVQNKWAWSDQFNMSNNAYYMAANGNVGIGSASPKHSLLVSS